MLDLSTVVNINTVTAVPTKVVKAYAAMPIDCLRFAVFTNKKTEGIDTFVCAVSLYVPEIRKASKVPPLPIIPFGIVAYSYFIETAVFKAGVHLNLIEILGSLKRD